MDTPQSINCVGCQQAYLRVVAGASQAMCGFCGCGFLRATKRKEPPSDAATYPELDVCQRLRMLTGPHSTEHEAAALIEQLRTELANLRNFANSPQGATLATDYRKLRDKIRDTMKDKGTDIGFLAYDAFNDAFYTQRSQAIAAAQGGNEVYAMLITKLEKDE